MDTEDRKMGKLQSYPLSPPPKDAAAATEQPHHDRVLSWANIRVHRWLAPVARSHSESASVTCYLIRRIPLKRQREIRCPERAAVVSGALAGHQRGLGEGAAAAVVTCE